MPRLKQLQRLRNGNIIYGDMRTKESIQELEKLCLDIDKNNRRILIEIGSYRGESTSVFSNCFEKVICIDPWTTGYDETDRGSKENGKYIEDDFKSNMKNNDNIIIIKKFSYDALDDVKNIIKDELVDAVYIDGGHQYNDVFKDLELYEKIVKKNGFICGDDYKLKYPGLMKAVDEFRKTEKFKNNEFKIYNNNSFVLKK